MTRIVFMGSPDEVVAPLRELFERGSSMGFELVGVISQPARPSGRGGRLVDPAVASFAKLHSIKCLQPESSKSPEFLAEFAAWLPDIVVTAAYGQILSEAFLAIPKIGTINIHPSRLPLFRGATPVPAALLDGLTTTAVTILFTVKKLDAGNIILQKEFPIYSEDTSGTLTARLFSESGPLLFDALVKISQNQEFKGISQDESEATFCKKIDKDMGAINWSMDAQNIVNRFRAFEPWPGSWTMYGDRRIAITAINLFRSDVKVASVAGSFVFDKSSKSIVVQTGHGSVGIQRLKPAGGKDMDAVSFWNGIKDKAHLLFSISINPKDGGSL